MGRTILGCSRFDNVPWAHILAQCGWDHRLSSLVLECAFIARARLFVLPKLHPAVRVFRYSLLVGLPCWANRVKELMTVEFSGLHVPDITECDCFQSSDFERAFADKQFRKLLLRRYRWEVVRPLLKDFDRTWYMQMAGRIQPEFGVPFVTWAPVAMRPPLELLEIENCPKL